MRHIDRLLVGSLLVGVWASVAIQMTSISHAQEPTAGEQDPQSHIAVIHATDIVGLSAMIQQAVRDHQFRPQSMPGLELYVKSIIRNCRISGSVTGNRLSSTNISC